MGNLYPTNTSERLIVIFIMLAGVIASSFIVELLRTSLRKIEMTDIQLFIGSIRRMNGDQESKA